MLRPLGPLVAGALAQWAPLPATLPYLPQLVLAAWALPLAAHTPETVRHDRVRDADDGLWRQMRIRGLGEPRFLWVVLPLAPWVFARMARKYPLVRLSRDRDGVPAGPAGLHLRDHTAALRGRARRVNRDAHGLAGPPHGGAFPEPARARR